MQRLPGLDLAGSSNHRGLRGAVVVDQLETLGTRELAQAIAADQQGAQRGVFDLLAERVLGHRRGQEAHVQRLRAPPGQQGVDVLRPFIGGRQVQGRADTQRRPHFPGHRIKAETGDAGGVAPGTQVKGTAVPVHQIGHRVVFNHHAFGQAGGAGGVDHIGEVGRGRSGLGVTRRMVLPGEAIQVDHRHIKGRQALQQGVLGQHRHRRTVGQQIIQTLGRVGRVDRYITGSGLEDRQQPGQGIQATTGDDGHAVIRFDAQRQQVMGQQVGLLVQLGVAQLAALVHRGDGLGCARGLGFDARMQRGALREMRLSGVELLQQLLSLGGRHHRHVVKGRLRRLLQRGHQVVQGGFQVGADALRVDQGAGKQAQAKAVTEVIHTQGQRVVGALFGAERDDPLPGRRRRVIGRRRTVTVIEQRTEQRRRRRHAAATLGQRQGGVLMAQQGGQPCMGGLDPGAHVLAAHVHAKRQRVDENPQRPIGVMAALHAAHQDGAEYHLFFARQHPQHLRPAQVEQAGGTHTELPGLRAQALRQRRRQWQADFSDAAGIALHILQPKRQRRLADIAEHLAKELFMFLLADAQPRLGHIVAKRHGPAQRCALPQQARLQFVAHHFKGTVVEGHMVEQQGRDDPLIQRVVGTYQA